jgi:hypothetical protein
MFCEGRETYVVSFLVGSRAWEMVVEERLRHMLASFFQKVREEQNEPPGKANGGGCTPGFWPSMGFDADCPSAAYEFVMESITDCAFSCPISASMLVWGRCELDG